MENAPRGGPARGPRGAVNGGRRTRGRENGGRGQGREHQQGGRGGNRSPPLTPARRNMPTPTPPGTPTPAVTPRPDQQQANPEPARPPAVYRAYGEKLDEEVFQSGVVISLPQHDPFDSPRGPEVRRPNRNTTLTYIGAWAHSKHRKMIIVQVYPDHVIAVPIFTNNRNGISRTDHKEEWIGVRDSEDVENADVTDSPHDNITIVRTDEYSDTDKQDFHRWNPETSYAHFTRPVCVNISTPIILEGYLLDEDQTRRLIELYFEWCLKCGERADLEEAQLQGMVPPDRQDPDNDQPRPATPETLDAPEAHARAQFVSNHSHMRPEDAADLFNRILEDGRRAHLAHLAQLQPFVQLPVPIGPPLALGQPLPRVHQPQFGDLQFPHPHPPPPPFM